MKHKSFKRAKDGEWIQPVMKNYMMACCDCGLVHRLDFRVVQGRTKQKVQFRASRAPLYTKRLRAKDGIVVR